MWSDVQADPPECSGSGARADPAPTLEDGFPGGRALCPVCWAFVGLRVDGTMRRHRSWRGDRTRGDADRRRAWFNTHGW